MFKTLLHFDVLRGEHSTGIAAVNSNKEVFVAKSVGTPYDLFDTISCQDIFRKSLRILIGHNRHATTGKINKRNAHPFEFDTLVGAHNGTLYNRHNIPNNFKYDVDSEAMFALIDEIGIEEAMKKIEGAWALSIYDKEEEALMFLRNSERPLHFLQSKDRKTLFWASEAWMLTVALSREKYEYDSLFELPENTLFKFKIGFESSLAAMPVIEKPKGKRVEGKKSSSTVFNSAFGRASQVKQLPSVSQTPAKETDKRNEAGYDKNYLGSKKNLYTVVGETSEASTGARYLICKDKKYPDYLVRLYINNSRSMDLLPPGAEFNGDVNSVGYTPHGICYYKISPWSVDPHANTSSDEVFHIPKKNGVVLSKEDFEKTVEECSWCSSPISYGDECVIGEDVFLCSNCIHDAEVAEYLPGLLAAH